MWRYCVTGSLACASAYGTDYTWTGDGSDDKWTTNANWSPSGHPNGDSDTATIPNNVNRKYPLFDAAELTIGSLTISASAVNVDELVFESVSSGSRVLKINDRDGLSAYGGSKTSIKLQQNSQLWLLGGGTLDLGEKITFAVGTGASAPRIVIGEGQTVSIAGPGTLLADSEGVVTGEVAEQNDGPETLVVLDVSASVRVKGSFTFDTILFAHGAMNTSKDGSAQGTIRMTCHPKGGFGTIAVDGGTAQSPSQFIIDCAYVGWGDLVVGPYGKLQVNRHHVTLRHVYQETGDLTLKRGGKIGIAAGIYFEADKHLTPDCPPPAG
ncbi:MAG: hypothetical protein C4547_00850 [Phycisphaerales bacterium]|nr:MAG: hypothetical protein C4547_00850 [Phycisphaerales bacterium]